MISSWPVLRLGADADSSLFARVSETVDICDSVPARLARGSRLSARGCPFARWAGAEKASSSGSSGRAFFPMFLQMGEHERQS